MLEKQNNHQSSLVRTLEDKLYQLQSQLKVQHDSFAQLESQLATVSQKGSHESQISLLSLQKTAEERVRDLELKTAECTSLLDDKRRLEARVAEFQAIHAQAKDYIQKCERELTRYQHEYCVIQQTVAQQSSLISTMKQRLECALKGSPGQFNPCINVN
jgi:hypothetical protein